MITIIKHNNLTWIDLEAPSSKEVDEIAKEYSIHELVAEELNSRTMRPKVDIYKNNLYLILHFPFLSGSKQKERKPPNREHEIDFVLGKDFLITSHYSKPHPLRFITKRLQASSSLRDNFFQNKASFLLFNLIKELYERSLVQLDETHLKINRIEEALFDGDERKNLKRISQIKRDLLDFRKNINPHDSILESLRKILQKGDHRSFFSKDFDHYLNILDGDYLRLKNSIQNSKETIETLHETNESLLSTKTNEVMKTLTILAFITFPLMLLSSVFGMNAQSIPIVGIKGDFWIITAMMLIATFGMFSYFRGKKWL